MCYNYRSHITIIIIIIIVMWCAVRTAGSCSQRGSFLIIPQNNITFHFCQLLSVPLFFVVAFTVFVLSLTFLYILLTTLYWKPSKCISSYMDKRQTRLLVSTISKTATNTSASATSLNSVQPILSFRKIPNKNLSVGHKSGQWTHEDLQFHRILWNAVVFFVL